MTQLDAVELLVTGDTVTIPVPFPSPTRKGSVDVALAMRSGGAAVSPALERSLVVRDGVLPPFVVFTRDLRALFPRGARLFLVVRYAGQLLATGTVRLLV